MDGTSKTFEDTERYTKKTLPGTEGEGETKSHRVAYAVHELLSTSENDGVSKEDIPSRFIGLIGLKPLRPESLTIRPDLLPPSTLEPGCLTVEMGYSYLPSAWGKGYATGAVKAVIETCKRRETFWEPYDKVFVRAIVGPENVASQRVMAKSGMKELGIHVWEGEAIFVGGKWRTRDELRVYGTFVIG
jgi:RimJ/RimL family protein N-acetyltransferase